MKKKYEKAEICITVFECESIMTKSAKDVDGLALTESEDNNSIWSTTYFD